MIRAYYAGIALSNMVDFTLRQGLTPSTGEIVFLPQSIPPRGDLQITTERGNVNLRNMYILKAFWSKGEQGELIHCTVADKRCLWEGGYLEGSYNEIQKDTGVPNQEKTLTQLLGIAFAEYGETNINYYGIPNVYPKVEWDGIKPVSAIQELLNKYGLNVSIDANGRVYVFPENAYYQFPAGDIIEEELTQEVQPRPWAIQVVGSPIVEQVTLDLQPVGVDLDGVIKPIDDLSYKPSLSKPYTSSVTIWGFAMTAKDLQSLWSTNVELKAKLAASCIFRWYGLTDSEKREKYLPWLNHITDLSTLNDDEPKHLPPKLKIKRIKTDGITLTNESSQDDDEVINYDIDHELGIVKFDQMVAKYDDSIGTLGYWQAFMPADVQITIAYQREDRYTYTYELGGVNKFKPAHIHKDESLVLYMKDGEFVANQLSNLDDFSRAICEKLAEKFPVKQESGQKVYAGLVNRYPWGYLKSVHWKAGDDGYQTILSTGEEEIQPMIPTYQERLTTRKTAALHWAVESSVKEKKQEEFQRQR